MTLVSLFSDYTEGKFQSEWTPLEAQGNEKW
jgi:hypothetical protein